MDVFGLLIIFLLGDLFCTHFQADNHTDFRSVGSHVLADREEKEEKSKDALSHPGIAGNSGYSQL